MFYFRYGDREEYFIGSADAMKRNLSSRIEILVPVEDPEIRARLRLILETQLRDRRNGWEMRPDGSYVQLLPTGKADALGSQEELIRWTERRSRKAAKVGKRKPRILGPKRGLRRV